MIPGIRQKNAFLIIISLVFYACGQWQGIPFLLISALLTYIAIRLMAHLQNQKARKYVLTVVLCLNLLLLATFKYLDFLTDSLDSLLRLQIPAPHLLLPVGISFFTFKAMACVIDFYRIYQDKSKFPDSEIIQPRFFDILLYISFFPQITSGPITRFGQFSEQLEDRSVDRKQEAQGLRRFITGFAKKILIAGLVAPIVNHAFSLALSTGLDFRVAWLGAIAYTLQIYFDFSGYSDMAIGLGNLFGFQTPENFDYPYISSSITEFWRRWHISLSSWFRDYLYIPLGGGRCKLTRKCWNKFVVFLLCGLWHGASWTFVFWGAWHGIFTALESIFPIQKLQSNRLSRVLSHIYTLLVVCLGFVIFRATNFDQALNLFQAMFTGFVLQPKSTFVLERISPASWLALSIGLVACTPIWPRLKEFIKARQIYFWPELISYIGAAILFILCVLSTAGSGFQPFIYAQF